jgi:hypothetical protein
VGVDWVLSPLKSFGAFLPPPPPPTHTPTPTHLFLFYWPNSNSNPIWVPNGFKNPGLNNLGQLLPCSLYARTFETCRSSDVYNYMIFYSIIGHRDNKIQILLDICIDNFLVNFFFEKKIPSKVGSTNFTPHFYPPFYPPCF